jgi:hypothetical protein
MIGSPPPLATWLLTRLTSGEKSESLVGDVIEQYQRGRSAAWYWRQVIAAIAGSFATQVWRNTGLGVAVVAVNLLLPYAYVRVLWHWVVVRVDQAWYPRFVTWLLENHFEAMWRVTYRLHLWALTGTVAWCALLAVVTWTFVRWFPRQRGLVLTLCLFTNVGECAPTLRSSLIDWLHDPGNPVWCFNLTCSAVFALVLTPLSILRGGRRAALC